MGVTTAATGNGAGGGGVGAITEVEVGASFGVQLTSKNNSDMG